MPHQHICNRTKATNSIHKATLGFDLGYRR